MISFFLSSLVIRILVNIASLWLVSLLMSDAFQVVADPTWAGYVLIALLLSLLNIFLRPLLKLISLPFIVVTMGLMLIVINTIMLYSLEFLLEGALGGTGVSIEIDGGIILYVIVGTLLAIINTILNALMGRDS